MIDDGSLAVDDDQKGGEWEMGVGFNGCLALMGCGGLSLHAWGM